MTQTELKISQIKTDRTKANSKKSKENVEYYLKWLKQYGVDLIVKTHDWGHSHEIYQAHTTKNGKPCEKTYSYMDQGQTLDQVHTKLHAIVCLFQDRYIFEDPNVKNDKKLTWKLMEIEA